MTDKMDSPKAIVLIDRKLPYHYITSHHNTVTLACPFPSPKPPNYIHFHPKKRSHVMSMGSL